MKTYHVAVLGAGAIGTQHIASFQAHPAARVVAVADTSLARGQEAARRFHVPEAVTDYRPLLKRADLDVISIALPNYLHVPVGLAAVAAGRHVMVDKPLATNAADAAKLIAAARRRKVLLMVGQSQRFTPEVQTARQLVAGGVLGDVYHARTTWMRRCAIPRIGSWFTEKKFAGGGCTYDIGVHALDRCLHLMGEFEAVAVSGRTSAQFGPRGRGEGNWGRSEVDPRKPFNVEDFSVALITLRSGRTVLLESSWAAHQAENEMQSTQLYGTEAGLILPPLKLFRPGPDGYITEQVKLLPPKVEANRMAHFIDCLLGRAKPHVPTAESLATQRILDAVYESARTGREIRLR